MEVERVVLYVQVLTCTNLFFCFAALLGYFSPF